jgi:hypothetical protein
MLAEVFMILNFISFHLSGVASLAVPFGLVVFFVLVKKGSAGVG